MFENENQKTGVDINSFSRLGIYTGEKEKPGALLNISIFECLIRC